MRRSRADDLRTAALPDCGFESTPPLAKMLLHAGVAVLHVRGRVAGHGQHLVVAEDVVARAVVGEVGVLDRADADPLGDLSAVFLGEQRLGPGVVVFADDRVGPLDRFVEQAGQADRSCRCGS